VGAVYIALERMGPLFSMLIAAFLGVVVLALGFVCALWALPARAAFFAGVCASLGSGVGAVVAVVLTLPFVGVGAHLDSLAAVATYLCWLAFGAIAGGGLFEWGYIHWKRKSLDGAAF
jgi:hypothetical protein